MFTPAARSASRKVCSIPIFERWRTFETRHCDLSTGCIGLALTPVKSAGGAIWTKSIQQAATATAGKLINASSDQTHVMNSRLQGIGITPRYLSHTTSAEQGNSCNTDGVGKPLASFESPSARNQGREAVPLFDKNGRAQKGLSQTTAPSISLNLR